MHTAMGLGLLTGSSRTSSYSELMLAPNKGYRQHTLSAEMDSLLSSIILGVGLFMLIVLDRFAITGFFSLA